MDLDPTKNEELDLAKNNHQPPANAEELLARYAAGERAFAELGYPRHIFRARS